MLYALSTCIWCRKTRQFLEDSDVAFRYTYVDLLDGDERTQAINEVRGFNPAGSFPTLVIDEDDAIVGFKADAIREMLGL